jgi:hypothetical protein
MKKRTERAGKGGESSARSGRGRRRKHKWIEFESIDDDSSPEAQYLRWASVNNRALARCAYSGCPRCTGKSFRLRHDEEFENIRFYCPTCRFETSFHIISPKRDLDTIEIYNKQGILVGMKTADNYHERTERESTDAIVQRSEQRLDLGGEWFDGVSGVNSQSRYMTREESLKRIEEHRIKQLMEAILDEIEHDEQENRASAFRDEILGQDDMD